MMAHGCSSEFKLAELLSNSFPMPVRDGGLCEEHMHWPSSR
jgi:hypothetical protein